MLIRNKYFASSDPNLNFEKSQEKKGLITNCNIIKPENFITALMKTCCAFYCKSEQIYVLTQVMIGKINK